MEDNNYFLYSGIYSRFDNDLEKRAIFPASPHSAVLNYAANTARESETARPLYNRMARRSLREGLTGLKTSPFAAGLFSASPLSQFFDPVYSSEQMGGKLRDILREIPAENRAAAIDNLLKNLPEDISKIPTEYRPTVSELRRLNSDTINQYISTDAPKRSRLFGGGRKTQYAGNIFGGFLGLGSSGGKLLDYDVAGAAGATTADIAGEKGKSSLGKMLMRSTDKLAPLPTDELRQEIGKMFSLDPSKKYPATGIMPNFTKGYAEAISQRAGLPVSGQAKVVGKFMAPAFRSAIEQLGSVAEGENALGTSRAGTMLSKDITEQLSKVESNTRLQRAAKFLGNFLGRRRVV